jgi:glycopeptide antibiotics resistance protein
MNAVIYVPLGIYLALLLKPRHRLAVSFSIVFFSSVLFELIQLVTGFGGCDGTDLFCNTCGGILGYLLFVLLLRRLPPKAINLINAAVILLSFLPAGYAVVNTLLHLELYRIA